MRLKGIEHEHLLPSWIINKLTKTMDADIRVVSTWDTDMTDVSLHGLFNHSLFSLVSI
jgi:N-acetyl-beta-hexosaminidase